MDGTVIDSMGVWKELAARSFEENSIPVPDDLEHRIFSMTFTEAAEYCIGLSGMRITPAELVDEWNQKAREFYRTDIPLKPGADEFIKYLKNLGMKISLTTSNFYEIAIDVLKRNGLYPLFDSVTSTQEVTRSKLYPDVFLLSAERLGTRPEDCIVFEDSYTSVLGAKKAGMYVVGIYDKYASFAEESIRREAHSYIISFRELLNNDGFFLEGENNE